MRIAASEKLEAAILSLRRSGIPQSGSVTMALSESQNDVSLRLARLRSCWPIKKGRDADIIRADLTYVHLVEGNVAVDIPVPKIRVLSAFKARTVNW